MDEENELIYENQHESNTAILIVGGYSIIVTRDDETQAVNIRAKNLETDSGVDMTLGKEGATHFGGET